MKLDSPKLEGGRTENEPALITHPQWVNNGAISGRFSALKVDLSSLAGSSVEFVLAVQSNGAFNEDLAFWLAPKIIGIPR